MDAALRSLRAAFPALEEGLCFLDWAATGLLCEPARRGAQELLDELAACPEASATWVHVRHGETRARLRGQLAAMIGGRPDDIALVESTTAGLNAAASALKLRAGDHVILSGLDYPAVALPWRHRARRDGLELRVVPPRDGAVLAEDLLEQIDARTRVVAIATLAWTTGALLDVEALAREARQRGIVLVIDAIQTFGVIPFDLARTPAAFVACGGHKWLASPLGTGFLHVAPETAARNQPPFVGLLSGFPPRGNWGTWFMDPEAGPDSELGFPAVGRAYETGGTPCYPGAVGLLRSLELLSSAGTATIAAHVRRLGTRLIEGLDRLGHGVVTPRDPERRAGVVVFNLAGGVVREQAFVERLRERRIVAGVRYFNGLGGVRISLHGMNVEDDVDRVLEALAAF